MSNKLVQILGHLWNKDTQKEDANPKSFDVVSFIMLTIATSIALVQFFYNRSLWNDEAALALNILHRNPVELMQPLDIHQSAPLGFLLVEDFFNTLFPLREFGLRVFPLFCYIFSLFLFQSICRRLIISPYAAICVYGLFAASPGLLYYATDVKQYIVDVMIGLLLIQIYLSQKNKRHYLFILAIAGIIAPFFSNSSIFILAGIGFALLYQILVKGWNWKNFSCVAVVGVLWILSFCVYYLIVKDDSLESFMHLYWLNADPSFLFRQDSFSNCFFVLIRQLVASSSIFFGFFPIIVPICIAIAFGSVYLIVYCRKNGELCFLCFVPIVCHVIASILEAYPFAPRMLLYAIPLIFLIASPSFSIVFRLTSKKSPLFSKILLFCISVIPFWFLIEIVPLERFEIKPCLKFINQNLNPETDKVFVEYSAIRSFRYYSEIGFVSDNVKNCTVGHLAELPLPNVEKWMKEKKSNILLQAPFFTGRTWIVMAYNNNFSIVPKHWSNAWLYKMMNKANRRKSEGGYSFQQLENYYIQSLIKDNQAILLKEFRAPGASALLFDFQGQHTPNASRNLQP